MSLHIVHTPGQVGLTPEQRLQLLRSKFLELGIVRSGLLTPVEASLVDAYRRAGFPAVLSRALADPRVTAPLLLEACVFLVDARALLGVPDPAVATPASAPMRVVRSTQGAD